MFDKILIANRGEIACRIMRTCRRLGIATVAVYSEADAHAQHVLQADEAYLIGGPRPAESYLRGDVIIDVAKKCGAQAIHPGYGFLSENADFADAAEKAGLIFIGPRAASMRKMGSKAGAKALMTEHKVPVVPGYTDENQQPEHLHAEANRIGYPLMIKAAHGGGGKGMRIVRSSDEFLSALLSCQRESINAFGKDRVLLERYIEKPRHIEIQIFADSHGNTIHLNERECSAQRRYQKVIEESPSPSINDELRQAMGAAAIQAAKAIDYRNAGTVEFIVDQSNAFFFIEINTRLQVEHPVTEMVSGLDLVEWQIRVAAGQELPLKQDQIQRCGHAIEVRIYAEDATQNFMPGSGQIKKLTLPATSESVRIDSGVIEGDTISIFYDPMISKLIVHAADRPPALALLRDTLAACEIQGLKTNIGFLESLIRHPLVVEGRIDTSYLDQHLETCLPTAIDANDPIVAAAATACLLFDEATQKQRANLSVESNSPWLIADGWRLGHAGERLLRLELEDTTLELRAQGYQGSYEIIWGDQTVSVTRASLINSILNLSVAEKTERYIARVSGEMVSVHDGNRRLSMHRKPAFEYISDDAALLSHQVHAPMPGRIVAISTQVGDKVVEGQELAVMEAMKMELSLKAPRDGEVAEVRSKVGDFVESDAVLIGLCHDE